jgi:endonuclease YncB( thermonuclease family)
VLGLVLAFAASAFSGPVVGIADGDTLTVLFDSRPVTVRIAEIDAPETGQPWSRRARQALSEKVFQQIVTVEPVTRDRYGRTVGYVRLGGREIHREMVREGHAWAYRRYLVDGTLLDDETAARNAGAGLWALPESDIAAPWLARTGRSVRDGATATGAGRCGTKRYCREMDSCAEARFHFRACGRASLDGDGDGVPCERLCR